MSHDAAQDPRNSIVIAGALLAGLCRTRFAGDYYVYSCSYYGNTAPAFVPWTNADHLTPDNACMQPAPGGGYRTLELDNPAFGSAPVLNGYGANWTADAPRESRSSARTRR